MTERLWSIGEVAELLGVAASALRWWEKQGLVTPEPRRSGRRYYRWAEVRRLAMIQLWQDTGLMSLDDIGVLLGTSDVNSHGWRAVVRSRAEACAGQIARLQAAQQYLEHALECHRSNPVVESPYLREEIDQRLEQLGASPR